MNAEWKSIFYVKRMTLSNRRLRRSGYVLVLVAMLLFGLMAMAALVIDVGFARLAQRQMQSAADTAALEGLRGKGAVEYAYGSRQSAAENFVAWQFDDNNATYKPVMQRGLETPAEFRIRLQRGGLLDDSTDLFAQGPAVPYLFARGSYIDQSLIGDGIALRASSIAQPKPALKVGLPVAGIFPGAIPIGYEIADWNTTKNNPLVIDSPKTIIGQDVTTNGTASALSNGYCAIFADVSGLRVVGFGWIDRGSPLLETNIAPGNAVSGLGEVWADIDPAIRRLVLEQNAGLINGLSVATPKSLR